MDTTASLFDFASVPARAEPPAVSFDPRAALAKRRQARAALRYLRSSATDVRWVMSVFEVTAVMAGNA